jgi:hypothetical protein
VTTTLPDFVVVGAGKCGTSSLHHYLDCHPEITMSATKEPKYFVREANWGRGRAWYEAQFAGRGGRVRGEVSPQYTKYPVHDGVAERMHAVIPGARLVYLVRDPVERMVAYWIDRRARGRERRDFAAAVTGSPDDGYVNASRYHLQLEQYLPYFPLERILVVDQRELREDRRSVLREVFAFLGVDASFDSPRFDRVHNETASKRRMRDRPAWLPRDPAPAPSGRVPRRVRAAVRGAVLRPFSTAVEPPVVEGLLRERLVAALQPDAERFRGLTGLRFDHWSV